MDFTRCHKSNEVHEFANNGLFFYTDAAGKAYLHRNIQKVPPSLSCQESERYLFGVLLNWFVDKKEFFNTTLKESRMLEKQDNIVTYEYVNRYKSLANAFENANPIQFNVAISHVFFSTHKGVLDLIINSAELTKSDRFWKNIICSEQLWDQVFGKNTSSWKPVLPAELQSYVVDGNKTATEEKNKLQNYVLQQKYLTIREQLESYNNKLTSNKEQQRTTKNQIALDHLTREASLIDTNIKTANEILAALEVVKKCEEEKMKKLRFTQTKEMYLAAKKVIDDSGILKSIEMSSFTSTKATKYFFKDLLSFLRLWKNILSHFNETLEIHPNLKFHFTDRNQLLQVICLAAPALPTALFVEAFNYGIIKLKEGVVCPAGHELEHITYTKKSVYKRMYTPS